MATLQKAAALFTIIWRGESQLFWPRCGRFTSLITTYITSSQFPLNIVQAVQREVLFRAPKQPDFVPPYDGKVRGSSL